MEDADGVEVLENTKDAGGNWSGQRRLPTHPNSKMLWYRSYRGAPWQEFLRQSCHGF
jgi:hypothetical protein